MKRGDAIGLAVMAAVGVAMLIVAWHGAASTGYTSLQLPWLLSGSLAGMAVIGVAACSAVIRLQRHDNARHRREFDPAIADVVAALESRRTP